MKDKSTGKHGQLRKESFNKSKLYKESFNKENEESLSAITLASQIVFVHI